MKLALKDTWAKEAQDLPNMNGASQLEEFENVFNCYRQTIELAAHTVAVDFKSFAVTFERAYKDARQERAPTTPYLNVLQVFGLETRELRHSDALAWFLREDGEHEQGDLFMRTFLNELLKPFGLIMQSPIAPYTVGREKSYKAKKQPCDSGEARDDERRRSVDVVAHARGKFAIFIENKVNAGEQDNQFSDLEDFLYKFSIENSIPENKRFAVFLTDTTDKKPKTGSGKQDTTIVRRNVKRTELFGWFGAALQNSPVKSPLLIQFLDNYLHAIKQLSE